MLLKRAGPSSVFASAFDMSFVWTAFSSQQHGDVSANRDKIAKLFRKYVYARTYARAQRPARAHAHAQTQT